MPWTDDAACRGNPTELFFPACDKFGVANTPRGQADEAAAKAICAGCPVWDDCRQAHIAEPEGIFFGTNPKERRALRRVLPPTPRVPLKPKHCANEDCPLPDREFKPVRARQRCCSRSCGRALYRRPFEYASARAAG